MTVPFVSALPLRIPVPHNDMAAMLASWMDHSPEMMRGLSSSDCQRDLETIGRLRRDIGQILVECGNLKQPPNHSNSDEESLFSLSEMEEKLHEYYHLLLECESHGMVHPHKRGNNNNNGGSSSSSSSNPVESSEFLVLEWESSMAASCLETADSLESERANIVWNMAALEAHRATQENLTTKLGWNKAAKRLQKAASWLGHLLREQEYSIQQHTQTEYNSDSEMSPAFLSLWQALLMAQAQHCIYESLSCVKRPMHLLAAKLAAAAVPLYHEVTKIKTNTNTDGIDINQQYSSEYSAPLVIFARAWGSYIRCQAEYHQSQIHREKKDWGLELARLDVAYQHAAVCKNLCDNEQQQQPSSSSSAAAAAVLQTPVLDELRSAVDEKLTVLQSRLETAQRENDETHRQAIPAQDELTEIRGEKLVKCDEPLFKLLLSPKARDAIFQTPPESIATVSAAGSTTTTLPTTTIAAAAAAVAGMDQRSNLNHRDEHPPPPSLPSMPLQLPLPLSMGTAPPQLSSTSSSSFFLDQKKKAAPPLFSSSHQNNNSNNNNNNNLQTYVEIFRLEINEIIQELARATEDQSESARLALNEVHLPHSLTAYQQEQSGGGLPEDLWERVHLLQQQNLVIKLKQELWELKDAADLARENHQKIASQLDFDTSTDRTFREENPEYRGHDAGDAQKSFRKPLANYNKLLSSAQEGDSVLFQRLEQLDIEPKYDLLQFSKSQLDLLLPGAKRSSSSSSSSNNSTNSDSMVIDTQHLSYLCGELVKLFQKKTDLMTMMRNEFHEFDIAKAIEEKVASTQRTDEDYLEATKYAQKAFERMRCDIQSSMEHQNELLGTILVENEVFMNSRERTTNSQSAESCISMIEDAMDEIDQLSKHLKEGKDFYNVVIPKLDELKHQVGDVSARLAVERLEYCETEKKASQEQKDAEMAQQLNNESPPRDSSEETSTENTASDTDAPPSSATNPSASAAEASGSDSAAQAPSVTARAPVSNVDDEKVATLVAMEFDADKVVAALEKHDNNMDHALNDLLSC